MDTSNIKPAPDPLGSMEVALKGLSMRNKAIAANIANVNTKDYKRRHVDFESALQAQISGNDGINSSNPTHYKEKAESLKALKDSLSTETEDSDYGLDTSNVDLDREVIDLTKTTLRYKAIAKMTKQEFNNMRMIIDGGGR